MIVWYPLRKIEHSRSALQSPTCIHAQCSTCGTVAKVTAVSPILWREAIPVKQFRVRGPAAQMMTNHMCSYMPNRYKHLYIFSTYLRLFTILTILFNKGI